MSVDVTFDIGQLERFAKGLRKLERDPDAIGGLTEALADVWVDAARRRMGYDTGQLYNRTGLVSLRSSPSTATATVEADTPYAGFHNYGTRWTRPNRYWDHGLEAAGRAVTRLDGKLSGHIERVLVSGGDWNPRQLA